MTESLSSRFGWIDERLVFVHAALLASEAAHERGDGFGAADVRFFFLLFTNWAEHDVLHPEQDIELTQVRRVLDRLVAARWARRVAAGRGARARGGRFALREEGIVGLAAAIDHAAERRRPFEELVFAVVFAASYGDAIRARAGRGAAARSILDVRALLARARDRSRAVLGDLEERVRSGRALADEVRAAKNEAEALRRLGERDAYQLHRVRPLADVLRALPDDLRRFELSRGIALRADALFAPLAARARAELEALDQIERAVSASLGSPPRARGR